MIDPLLDLVNFTKGRDTFPDNRLLSTNDHLLSYVLNTIQENLISTYTFKVLQRGQEDGRFFFEWTKILLRMCINMKIIFDAKEQKSNSEYY